MPEREVLGLRFANNPYPMWIWEHETVAVLEVTPFRAMCRFIVAVGICIGVSIASWAQAQAGPRTMHANLATLERMWVQAQVRRDAKTVAAMIGDQFIDTEYDAITKDRKAFLAEIADPKVKPSLMEIDKVEVETYGPAAVVSGAYHAKGKYNGNDYEHWGRFTDTWVYQESKWVCVAALEQE